MVGSPRSRRWASRWSSSLPIRQNDDCARSTPDLTRFEAVNLASVVGIALERRVVGIAPAAEARLAFASTEDQTEIG
jgi:hypothetical protein